MLVKGFCVAISSLEWPQLLSVLLFILLRKLKRKETGFMASETEKGALAEKNHVMIMYVPLLWLGAKNL